MSYITESGIPDIGKIPWGSHFCQMYSTRGDLAQSVIPYFLAGLINNERCIWVTSEPYNAEHVATDFKMMVPGFDTMIKAGRLSICDHNERYGKKPEHWLEEEQRSLREGYEGLRISANTSFVRPLDWDAFMQHERDVHKRLTDRRVVALCSYNITKVEPTNAFEMVRAHQFSIRRNNGFWEVLGSDG